MNADHVEVFSNVCAIFKHRYVHGIIFYSATLLILKVGENA